MNEDAEFGYKVRQILNQGVDNLDQRITGRQSEQDVRHLEIGLDAALAYEPGDALGVWARNSDALVSRTLSLTGLSADQLVSLDGRELALDQWLRRERELTRLSRRFVQEHAERHDLDALKTLLKPEHQSDLSHLLGNFQFGIGPDDVDAERSQGGLDPIQLLRVAAHQQDTQAAGRFHEIPSLRFGQTLVATPSQGPPARLTRLPGKRPLLGRVSSRSLPRRAENQ